MWIYVQKTGELFNAKGELLASGYSGYPPDKNKPESQDLVDKGPIPVGEYLIGEPRSSLDHGPYVLRLTPDAGNEMYGRTAFLIHGDRVDAAGFASRGCVILKRPVREAMWNSGDHLLEVVAERQHARVTT